MVDCKESKNSRERCEHEKERNVVRWPHKDTVSLPQAWGHPGGLSPRPLPPGYWEHPLFTPAHRMVSFVIIYVLLLFILMLLFDLVVSSRPQIINIYWNTGNYWIVLSKFCINSANLVHGRDCMIWEPFSWKYVMRELKGYTRIGFPSFCFVHQLLTVYCFAGTKWFGFQWQSTLISALLPFRFSQSWEHA